LGTFLETLGTARDIGRLHEIGSVLIRHGLGDLVHRTGIARRLERAGRALHWSAPERTARVGSPERLRLALEELGPTFVKLGQLLGNRPDLLGPEWTLELSKLLEHATPLPFEELVVQLEEDLGAPPGEVFAELEREPLASASIAQVHRAKLADGTRVVLKIRRPGIVEVVEADLRLLARLAELLEEELAESRRFHPRAVIRQFERSIRHELDLTSEARSSERIAQNLAGEAYLVIPRIHWQWTTQRLLVQDFLDGPSAGTWARAGRQGPFDPKLAAAHGAQAVLRMVFVDGLYHADPHPGNVLLLPEGRLGLVDFGMIGRLSEERRVEIVTLLAATARHRAEQVVDVLLGWSTDDEVDLDLLTQDCAAFIERYEGLPLAKLDTTAMLRDIADIVRANEIALPADVTMLLKFMLTLDGTGKLLDPEFDVAGHVAPFAERLLAERRSPVAVLRRGTRDVEELLAHLPQDLKRIVTRVRRGRFKIDLDLERLEHFAQQIDRSANRMTIGLITSALIIGTAIGLNVGQGPKLVGMPVFALLGFLTSLVIGLWLIVSILRSKR
jgi:ubiquinone biosynthesis protein